MAITKITSGVLGDGAIDNSKIAANTITTNQLHSSFTLDGVTEGASELYFTTARARASVSAGGDLSYNSSTGVVSYTIPTTIASIANHDTADLAEGTNLYYTDARADARTQGKSLIPTANNTYSLGNSSMQWHSLYVGPGSLYIAGKKVIEDNSDTITISTDINQDLRVQTSGSGNIELLTGASGLIEAKSTLQLLTGKRITDSAGTNVELGDPIHMNSNKITNLGTPSASTDAATKAYADTKAPLASPTLTGVPLAPTAANTVNNTQIATTNFVTNKITNLIGGAPGTLDTLNELAAAINDDSNYNSTLTTALALKAPLASPTISSPTFTGTASFATASGSGSLALSSDSSQLQFGTGNRGQVFHNSAGLYMRTGTGPVYAQAATFSHIAADASSTYLTSTSAGTTVTNTLTINGDSNSTLTIGNAGTNANRIYAGAGDELYVGANNGYKLRFKTDGNIVMDNSGNLGIGASSPQRKLTVVGPADNAGDDNGILQLSVGTGINTDSKMLFGIDSSHRGYIHVVKPGNNVMPLILNPTGSTNGEVHIFGMGNNAGGNLKVGGHGTTANNRWSVITGTHYNDVAQVKGVTMLGLYSSSTENKLVLGGNIYEANPATAIEMWAAGATANSTGGENLLTLNGNGMYSHKPVYVGGNLLTDTSRNVTAATVASSGKLAVMASSVHGSYDLYNNGTTYLNGAVTLDAATTVQDNLYAYTAGIGVQTPNRTQHGSVDPILHVRGNTSATGSYPLVARFEAGNDASETGCSVLINHSNDRGLLIEAGRAVGGDIGVAHLGIVDSAGTNNRVITMLDTSSNFHCVGINTDTPSQPLAVSHPSGATNGTAQEVARFTNNGSGATSGYIYIGASDGVDWRIGKNVTGIAGNSNFSIGNHAGTSLPFSMDDAANATFLGAAPLLTLQTTANSGDPGITLKSNGAITNEGFQMWYVNNVGDAHIATTYNDAAASIRFHTGTGTDRGTNNERFVIGGDGINDSKTHLNMSAGTFRMRGDVALDHDGSSLYIKAPSNIYFYPSNVNRGNLATNGTLTVVALTESSSIRYKENVKPITNGLEVVNKLEPVIYDRTDNDSKDEPGFIAEEVLKFLPNVVNHNEEGEVESIKYTKIIAYLVDAVQELSAEVEKLKNG